MLLETLKSMEETIHCYCSEIQHSGCELAQWVLSVWLDFGKITQFDKNILATKHAEDCNISGAVLLHTSVGTNNGALPFVPCLVKKYYIFLKTLICFVGVYTKSTNI